jgi:hypothetical protein
MKPEDKMIAYHKENSCWEPLNLTGKWALDRRPGYEEYTLFLEHKGWFFERWIHEDDIEIRPAPHSVIYECGVS